MNLTGFPRFVSPSGFARENLRVTPNLLWPLAPSTYLAPYRHGASVFRRCRRTEVRFAPSLRPSAMPSLFPRVSSIRLDDWVDDEPWLSSNFASPDCAVDESSRPIRFRRLCLTFDALSISSVLRRRLAPATSYVLNQSASPAGFGLLSNSLPGHQLKETLGRFDLWKQV